MSARTKKRGDDRGSSLKDTVSLYILAGEGLTAGAENQGKRGLEDV